MVSVSRRRPVGSGLQWPPIGSLPADSGAGRKAIPALAEAAEHPESDLEPPRSGLAWPDDAPVGPEDAIVPLLTLVSLVDEYGNYARDEVWRHCSNLTRHAEPALSSWAFVVGMNFRLLGELGAAVVGSEVTADRFAQGADAFFDETSAEDSLSSQLARWRDVNFWVVVSAERRGLITPADVVTSAGINAVMCVLEPLLDREVDERGAMREVESLGERLVTSLIGVPDRHVVSALAHVASAALASNFEIDGDWMGRSKLSDRIVRPYFRLAPKSAEVLALEVMLHGPEELDSPPSTDYPPSTRAAEMRKKLIKSHGTREAVDAIFGAAIILAAVVEVEDWNLLDESEDQLALLDLGAMQDLEPVFVQRIEPSARMDVDEALRSIPLSRAQRAILSAWSSRARDFVSQQQIRRV